jgi:propanol-preferring alcohol dehydrogenase
VKAAVLTAPSGAITRTLEIRDVPDPGLTPGHCLLRVLACGVCRTDLHVVEGDLRPVRDRLIPGHQIVGEVVGGATDELPRDASSLVAGRTDGHCRYCRSGQENLCGCPATGYTVDGGYAE